MTTTEMPSSSECPHCGCPLEPLTITFGGAEHHVGYKDCSCPNATAERAEQDRRTLAEQRERDAKRYAERCRRAGIPERYLTAEHPKAASASDDPNWYIHGTQGTGKTHLAMAIARRVIARGKSVEVRIVPHLLEDLRSRNTEDRSITAKLAECDLLVLDDLGKESPTPYACERLFDIINDRYNSKLPVMVTSNYDPNSIAKRLSEGDTGRSIASRLSEMCRRIHMDGADRRLHHV